MCRKLLRLLQTVVVVLAFVVLLIVFGPFDALRGILGLFQRRGGSEKT